MTAIQKLTAPTSTRCPDRVLQLDWDEGIQEVAAILDSAGGARTSPRSVFFRLQKSEQYDYIPPLSELYEPLSYPLWYPRGGRGWAPDLNTPEHNKITQMWWYRQQALRLPHMHVSGRLFNEWAINMFCRMEDERLQHVKALQRASIATRSQLCELLANRPPTESAGIATPQKHYLPSTVQGSPRHLRRLRIDALETARRLGAPTWFITLTTNPHWPEIERELHTGQTHADRPDIVVR
eukprot:913281-Pyramimonas_sp.AAC.1